MTKILILSLLFGFGSAFSFAQIQGSGGTPHSEASFISSLQSVRFATPDLKSLRAEDAETDGKGIGPWRFGFANDVDFNLTNSGQWLDVQNGGKIWLFSAE